MTHGLVQKLLRADSVIDQTARMTAAKRRKERNDGEVIERRPVVVKNRLLGADQPAHTLDTPLRLDAAIFDHLGQDFRLHILYQADIAGRCDDHFGHVHLPELTVDHPMTLARLVFFVAQEFIDEAFIITETVSIMICAINADQAAVAFLVFDRLLGRGAI